MAAITFPHHFIKYGESFAAKAGAAIVAKYACVKLGGSAGEVIETAGVNERGIGFIKEEGTAVASGDHVAVYITGVVYAVAAAAISAGAPCETAAAGRVQTAGTGDDVVGYALAAAAGAGDAFPLLISLGELA